MVELVCMGGRSFRRDRSDGRGNLFEGAKETGSSMSWARSEGLCSRSLSLFGSYEPSPGSLLSARCLRAELYQVRFDEYTASKGGRQTFEIGS
jgi:hypothetical protein